MGIHMINAGALTTLQDLGRWGYQSQGICVGGAMDARSLKIANLLTDNEQGEAALEFALLGPTVEFTSDAVISITGGDFKPEIDGWRVPMYRAVHVGSGDVLSFGACASGRWGYLAVDGGFDIPKVLGSRSTNVKAGIGGYQGRALRTGDVIGIRKPTLTFGTVSDRSVPTEIFEEQGLTLRTVMGPQTEAFTQEGIRTFLKGEYDVTADFDRMGCRLNGPRVESKETSDILSDGIALGAIQITSQGQPIVLLSERQTTGGYAKIATVISVDIPLIAQAKTGQKVRFEAVTVSEAQRLCLEEQRQLEQWRASFGQVSRDTWNVLPRPHNRVRSKWKRRERKWGKSCIR